jgi:type II secretory pathway predicted ATPase ExeA
MVDVGHHWGLTHDPFAAGAREFVPLAGHVEAVARLGYAVEAGERLVELRASDGLGKTVVLRRSVEALRGPHRRVVLARAAGDGAYLMGRLIEAFGVRVSGTETGAGLWRTLSDCVRLCWLQGVGVVLAVDDAQEMDDPGEIERLCRLEPHPRGGLTVLKVGREEEGAGLGASPWGLRVRLEALTRSEAAEYLGRKLVLAGRSEATFTPRAITRLHLRSEGKPRGLDRLASLALMAGATRGLEVIGPEVIEGAAAECARA